MAPFSTNTPPPPPFSGVSLIFYFYFYFFLFSLWLIRGDASSGRNLAPLCLSFLSTSMSRPSGPFLARCCGDTTQLSALLNILCSIPDLICPAVWTAVHPAFSSSCHSSHPSHPVVQAQPNFKLDLKCLFLFNWHLKIT
jgi:hypothetical protein